MAVWSNKKDQKLLPDYNRSELEGLMQFIICAAQIILIALL